MGFVEFLGSKTTKSICMGLIVGQIGLLFNNISYAAGLSLPADQAQRAQNAKVEGNSKGLEYLENLQKNARSTSYAGNGDIRFESVKIDNSSKVTANQINDIRTRDANGNMVGLNLNNLSPDKANCGDPEKCRLYYENGQLPDTEDLQGLYGQDEDRLQEAAQSTHDNLGTVAKSGNKNMSVQGHVYAIMNGVANFQKPNLKNDPIFNNARGVMNGSVSNVFSDCGQTDAFLAKLKTTNHTPVYKTCVEEKTESCNIVKQPSLSILTYASGNNGKFIYGSCGENCTTYYVGDTAHGKDADYMQAMNSGNCQTNSVIATMYVANPEAITNVKLQAMTYAGAVKVILDTKNAGTPNLTAINMNSYGTEIDKSYALSCVNNHPYVRRNAEVDLTSYFKTKVGSNQYINFTIQYAGPKPILELEVKYDPSKAAQDDVWSGTKDCLNKAESITNGSLNGTVTCDKAFDVYSNGNIMANGTEINPKYMRSEFGLKGECSAATVKVKLDDNEKTEDQTLCSELQKKGCSFAAAKCVKTGETKSGQNECVLYNYTYDCGYDTDVSTPRTSKAMACPGDIACQGMDCMNLLVNSDATDNAKDFNKALALLNESQHAATDMKCTYKADGTLSCTFFGGERKTCNHKKMLGQSNDCCESPQTVNVREQIAAGLYASKVFLVKDMAYAHDIFDGTATSLGDYTTWNYSGTDSVGAAEGYSMIGGVAWDFFKNYTGVGQAYTKLTNQLNKPIVSTLNNILPYAGEVFAGAFDAATKVIMGDLIAVGVENIVEGVIKQWIDDAVQKIYTQIMEWCGKQVASSMAEGAASTATQQAMQNTAMQTLGTCICVIGWIYAAYSVAKMITAIMISCDDEEYEVAANIEQKLCDLVGGYCAHKFLGKCREYRNVYCCFESQLSRILNKQIRYSLAGHHIIYPNDYPQLAWGGPKEATCPGLTEWEVQNADWTKVDLTEWLSLLKASGKLSSDNINLDSLRNNYLPAGGYNSAGQKNQGQYQNIR